MTGTTQSIIAMAIKHGSSSYTNRADTQHPAYGFTEAALTAFAQDLLAGQCLHQIADPSGIDLVRGVERHHGAQLWLAAPQAQSLEAGLPASADNLQCKSVQKRLATQWGYVQAQPVVLPEPDGFLESHPFGSIYHRGNPSQIQMICGACPPMYEAGTVRALLATGGQAQAVDIAELVTGMSVSVDVSTGDDDAGNRYFGTVTLAQEDNEGKHGLTILVQDAEPNFTPKAQDVQRDNEWQEIHSLPVGDDLIWLYCQDTNTIDGPVAPSPSFVDSWSHWACAEAPSTTAIGRAAIAASAAKGGE